MDMQAAREKLTLENDMQQAEETKLQAKLTTAKARLELENTLHAEQQKQIHAQLNAEHEKMTLLNTLQEDQNKQQELKIATEVWKFNTSILDLKLQKEKLELQLALKDKTQDWEKRVAADPEYLRDPFVNGKLTISDRRIELNGVIWGDTAKRLIEQIEFYNNKNAEYPIFLVIDTCYGGSVMEGMQILKAMHNSRSPVYVVVKSFSASMCAVITTLANQSFALPDAVFIHHQAMNFSFGNRTEQREQLKILEEWTERLLRPVAEKMGLSLDEFIKQMYVHNAVGDWEEFADAAVKLKWVNHVVTDIRETGYLNKPDAKLTTEKEENCTEERIDEQGKRYVKVPRLRPLDIYHLHNPDNYYRH
jgi:ATP-dependent Clp protease protease subunit